jgi:hypothetical protein
LIANIAGHTSACTAFMLHFLNGCLHGLRVHVSDHNVSPFAPEPHCDSFPDSVRCTYDECDLILKSQQIVCLPIAHAQTPVSRIICAVPHSVYK